MDLLSFASSATETSGGGGFDLIGTILWPLKWLVELVLVAWHWLFTA
ncbi:MAG TPA: membrane protein insertase YidC, partial [Microbacterium sp.]|nr:membrane protein insertase YidC [Microbacterium sp.]